MGLLMRLEDEGFEHPQLGHQPFVEGWGEERGGGGVRRGGERGGGGEGGGALWYKGPQVDTTWCVTVVTYTPRTHCRLALLPFTRVHTCISYMYSFYFYLIWYFTG